MRWGVLVFRVELDRGWIVRFNVWFFFCLSLVGGFFFGWGGGEDL